MIFFENYTDMKMRKIENHYSANIPLQNYESISLAIWSKKVQILTTKSGSVSQSSSSASFTIAFGSYPAFHIFLKQEEGKYFNERTLKAIKGNSHFLAHSPQQITWCFVYTTAGYSRACINCLFEEVWMREFWL